MKSKFGMAVTKREGARIKDYPEIKKAMRIIKAVPITKGVKPKMAKTKSKFQKGQMVRVMYRKTPYVGKYYGNVTEEEMGEAGWHRVQFYNDTTYVKEKHIFPIKGL